MRKGFYMKSKIERDYERLVKYVMESKKAFERKIFIAVLFMYIYIIGHLIGFILGKVL